MGKKPLFSIRKSRKKLSQLNKLSMNYRCALAKSYFELGRESLFFDYSQYLRYLEKALTIFPDFKPNSRRTVYKFAQNICGFRQTEKIACCILFVRRFVFSISDRLFDSKGKFGITQ